MTQTHLADRLVMAASAHGDRVAMLGDGMSLTYTQLLSQSRQIAAELRDAGAGAHEPVLVQCSNHPTDFVAFLGVWMAGGVVAPVHRSTPRPVLDAMQDKARSRFMLDLLAKGDGAKVLRQLDSEQGPDDDARRRMLDDGALIIFTSGSTGMPKAAVLSHTAFSGKLDQNQRLLSLTAETVTMLVLNNTFSFGIWVALLTLLAGGRLVMQAKFSPAEFLATLVRERVSFLGVVPTMIRATFGTLGEADLAQAKAELSRVDSLKSVVIGGEPLGKDLSAALRAFIEPAGLYDIYGLTETSTCDFVLEPQDYPAHGETIGRPFPGIQFRVINGGNECPMEMPGELQLKTPYLTNGYLGDEALTSAAFEDGWFCTGDLAVRHEDGYVSIVGRLKEIIARGGNKITPVEVERALSACRGVAAALVTGVPDALMGQRIHALLVPKIGVTLDAKIIRAELSHSLERFKHPDACFIAEELPTGRTGKVNRGGLANWISTHAPEQLPSWSAPERVSRDCPASREDTMTTDSAATIAPKAKKSIASRA